MHDIITFVTDKIISIMNSIVTFNKAQESQVTSRFNQMMNDRKSFLEKKVKESK